MTNDNQTNTNTPKHTPGPWKVKVIQKQGDGYTHLTVGYADKYRTVTVADLHSPFKGYESGIINAEKQANAQLIAAAPDLLEALEAMVKVADSLGLDFMTAEGGIQAASLSSRALDKARNGIFSQAIAKAEGRAQTMRYKVVITPEPIQYDHKTYKTEYFVDVEWVWQTGVKHTKNLRVFKTESQAEAYKRSKECAELAKYYAKVEGRA